MMHVDGKVCGAIEILNFLREKLGIKREFNILQRSVHDFIIVRKTVKFSRAQADEHKVAFL